MRKYIDIINEFQQGDIEKMLTHGGDHGFNFNDFGEDPPAPPRDEPEDDRGNNRTIVISDILWDVDDPEEEAALPKRATTTLHDVEAAADPYADEDQQGDLMYMIGDWLTSTYDGRLSNFNYTIV